MTRRMRQLVGLVATLALLLAVLAVVVSRSEKPQDAAGASAALPRPPRPQRAGQPGPDRQEALRGELPEADARSLDDPSPAIGDLEQGWRIRVVGERGQPLLHYDARWLRDDSLASAEARRFAQAHEGQRRRLFEQLGDPLRPDAAGILRVPWITRPSAVAVSTEDAFGSMTLGGRPEPDVVRTLRLRAVSACTVEVLAADGRPKSGVRVDALWTDADGAARAPIGVSDAAGRLELSSDFATIRHVLDEARSNLELGIGIPGHGPGLTLPATGAWPAEAELRCEPLGTIRVVAEPGAHDLVDLRASLRIRDEQAPAGQSFAFPLEGADETSIPVAVMHDYAFEIEGGHGLHATGTVIGPRVPGDSVELRWTPSGLCTFRGNILLPDDAPGAGARWTIRLQAEGDARFPLVRSTAVDDEGRFRLTLPIDEIEGVESLLALDTGGRAYGPVAVEAREGVVDVGSLAPMREGRLSDLEVRAPDGAPIDDAQVTASAPATIVSRDGRYSVVTRNGAAQATVHVDAPGFAPQSLRITTRPELVVVTLEPTRRLAVEARIDAELDERMLRATLVRRGRDASSEWAGIERIAADRVRITWDEAPRVISELSFLTAFPPRELLRSVLDVATAETMPVFDLRGQHLSRWWTDEPTTPVYVVQASAESNLLRDTVVADPEGGPLVLDAPADVVFVRAGARPVLRRVTPGEDLRIAFEAPARLSAAWADEPTSPCRAAARIVGFRPAQAWHGHLRIWREGHTTTAAFEELVAAPQRAPADGFPLFFDGTFVLAVGDGARAVHHELLVRDSVLSPQKLLVTR